MCAGFERALTGTGSRFRTSCRVLSSGRNSQNATDTILGVDIGGTKTALFATARATGEKIAATTFDTPRDVGPTAMIAVLQRESEAMLLAAGVEPRSIRAVGCAVPGQVDGNGLVIGAGNLKWDRVPLREQIEAAWQVPAFVEQDANAGALGEMWRGVAQTMSDFVFVALGTGVGAGIVLGRRLHRGARHAAGELGDLVPDPRALGRGPRDEHNLASRIGSRALRTHAREATGDEIRAADVVSGAAADARLGAIARDLAADLAIVVIAIAAVLDPEAIILGGGTSTGGEALVSRVMARVKPELFREPVLVLAALGEEAQLYGAVAGAMARLDPDFVLAGPVRRTS